MRKIYWVLIILALLFVLFLFFNPFCGFHGIIPYTAEDGCNTCQCTFFNEMCTKRACLPNLDNCIKYFDGCNTCKVEDGKIRECTEKACIFKSEPKCLEYKST